MNPIKKTFFIAEAGSCHDGSIDTAMHLIDVAAAAGADAVKFQVFSSDTLYSKFTPDFADIKDIPSKMRSLELPRSSLSLLNEYCKHKKIEFMATPFDEEAIEQLQDLGVSRIKIAGFEAKDPRIVKYAAAMQLPIIFSAGIGFNDLDVIRTIEWIVSENAKCDITVLHCNNAYPTPQSDICLATLFHYLHSSDIVNHAENIRFGLSDHTIEAVTPALAVAMGATTIEKHFTYDSTYRAGMVDKPSKRQDNPDHAFAMSPAGLRETIRYVRLAEQSLGWKDSISESEQKYTMAMRSCVALKDIAQGEMLMCVGPVPNVTTKRPRTEHSIPASEFYTIEDSYAKHDIPADTILTYDMITNDLRT